MCCNTTSLLPCFVGAQFTVIKAHLLISFDRGEKTEKNSNHDYEHLISMVRVTSNFMQQVAPKFVPVTELSIFAKNRNITREKLSLQHVSVCCPLNTPFACSDLCTTYVIRAMTKALVGESPRTVEPIMIHNKCKQSCISATCSVRIHLHTDGSLLKEFAFGSRDDFQPGESVAS